MTYNPRNPRRDENPVTWIIRLTWRWWWGPLAAAVAIVATHQSTLGYAVGFLAVSVWLWLSTARIRHRRRIAATYADSPVDARWLHDALRDQASRWELAGLSVPTDRPDRPPLTPQVVRHRPVPTGSEWRVQVVAGHQHAGHFIDRQPNMETSFGGGRCTVTRDQDPRYVLVTWLVHDPLAVTRQPDSDGGWPA